MNISTGTNNGLHLSGEVDSDGELLISMAFNSSEESADTWLNKDHAKEIINHLIKSFDLDNDNDFILKLLNKTLQIIEKDLNNSNKDVLTIQRVLGLLKPRENNHLNRPSF